MRTNRRIIDSIALNRLKLFLPLSIQQNIAYVFLENDVLFFALKSPGALRELKSYEKIFVRQILNAREKFPDFTFLPPKISIKTFIPLNILTHFREKKSLVIATYGERADKNFQNHANDAQIFLAFEEIRKILCP